MQSKTNIAMEQFLQREKEIEQQLSTMRNFLFDKLTVKENILLGFHFVDGVKTCGVCQNTNEIDTAQYLGESWVEESSDICPVCGLFIGFAFGYSTIFLEGMTWNYSYTEGETDISYLHRNQETSVVADIYSRIVECLPYSEDEAKFLDLLEERNKLVDKMQALDTNMVGREPVFPSKDPIF